MIRTLLLLLTVVLCGFGWSSSDGAPTVAAPQSAKDSIGVPDGYRLVWHDEFEQDTVLNAEDWTHEVWGKGFVNNELQEYVNHKTPGGKTF